MSLPMIRVITLTSNNEPCFVELGDLTEVALGDLIGECKQLLDDLEDRAANVRDEL